MANFVATAQAVLDEDERLRILRHSLVPKQISEEVFWRRYFTAVMQVKRDMLVDYSTANKQHRKERVEASGATSSEDDLISELEKELQAELAGFEDIDLSPSSPSIMKELENLDLDMYDI